MPSEAFEVLTGNAQRRTDPRVNASDVEQFTSDNADFAFALYHELRRRRAGENLLFSPHSIASALAMIYSAAREETRAQMMEALRFALEPEALHTAFNALDLALMSRSRQDTDLRLRVANALWTQTGQAYLPEFLDTLSKHYGAGLHILDFLNEPETSRQIINAWVEKETEGRITDLIPAGLVDPATRLVLTNAVYFNAAWAQPFDGFTRPSAFHTPTGEVTTDFMNQESSFMVGDPEDGSVVVELPYRGDDLSMLIVMPGPGQFDTVEARLFGEVLDEYLRSLHPWDSVRLSVPKFEVEFEQELRALLEALGMVDAFRLGVADFSGIDGSKEWAIAFVRHKAFIAAAEEGTEAAAASSVEMTFGDAGGGNPRTVTLNRPFIFAIRDRTGALLFVGRVLDPS